MVILNLRDREPPIRAKTTCGKPSMITATKHTIGVKTKGWCLPMVFYMISINSATQSVTAPVKKLATAT